MTLNELTAAYTANKGKLTGEALDSAARIAWSHLLQQTMQRITLSVEAWSDDWTELIQNCFHELVDTVHRLEKDGIVTSESVGDWSQSYADTSGGQTNAQTYAGIIRRWLGDTDLLYRGCP